ncbi:MAG: IS1 family transposase [Proteobacteria bacterium]|nr:IS1 family transposase [Pseudomonadota bacterium]
MNSLPAYRQLSILQCFIEGNSIRSSGRLSGASPTTCLSLLKRAGVAAMKILDQHVRDVPCKRIEADEVWTYLRVKRDNLKYAQRGQDGGDVWLWVALCPDTKLVVSWKLGCRGIPTGTDFMHDLRGRLRNRIQLSTDGHDAYLAAVEAAFGKDIDYARKVVFTDRITNRPSAVIQVISGSPDRELVGTSHVERFNGTLRNMCRRYFRKSLAFSKSMENHQYAVALNMFAYNFCVVHGSLRVTPAMAAGMAAMCNGAYRGWNPPCT